MWRWHDAGMSNQDKTTLPFEMDTRVEHRSYDAHKDEAADYGRSPFWQHEAVKEALYKFSGSTVDLRGMAFMVTVSEDGLGVVIEKVETP